MTDGPIMDAVDALGEEAFAPEYVPVNGWSPEHFPQITVAPIPYTTNPQPRPDPFITVTQAGWLFIEVGNVRIAIPDQEEWDKLVGMVERMWHTWRRDQGEVTDEPELDGEVLGEGQPD